MLKKLLAISSLSIVSLSTLAIDLSPVSAATVKFEIDFFETRRIAPGGRGGTIDLFAGEKVGSGKLSYDDEIETCVEADEFSTCINPGFEQTNFIFVDNVITDFEVDLYGANVDEADASGTFWWSDGEQSPGQQFGTRTDPVVIGTGGWFFGDVVNNELSIDFAESSDTFGQGTWTGFNLTSFGENGLPIATPSSADGTWEARRIEVSPQSTPEPSAILSLLIVITSGYYFKKHQLKI